MHEYDLSIQASSTGIRLDPSAARMRYNLAHALLAKGAFDEAQAEYARAIAATSSASDFNAAIDGLIQLIGARSDVSEMAVKTLEMLLRATAAKFG